MNKKKIVVPIYLEASVAKRLKDTAKNEHRNVSAQAELILDQILPKETT